MTLFWLFAAGLVALIGWLILPGLLRHAPTDDVDRAEMNRALQRKELSELDAARTRGELDDAAYQQARDDLERRVLGSVEADTHTRHARPLGRAVAIVLTFAVPALAMVGYQSLGGGALAIAQETPAKTQAASPQVAAHAGMNMASAEAGPLDQLTERLSQRLRDNPDDADGWLLLARSYQHIGRHEDARNAYAQAQQRGSEDIDLAASLTASVPAEAAAAGMSPDVADAVTLKARVEAEPNNGDAWLALAQAERAQRNFTAASAAYAKAEALLPANADLLADYADTLAAANDRRLGDEPSTLIEQALTLDPEHPKALWLAATAALQRGDQALARTHWQRLQRIFPEGSPDRKVIDRNLAALGGDAPLSADSSATPAIIRGRVDISAELRARVSADDTVFIFARAADGPPMPLAVLRKQVRDLPFEFTLDDSMAMQPQLKLSAFDQVMLGARVSHSGTVTPQTDEPRVVLGPVPTRGGSEQRLLIDRAGS